MRRLILLVVVLAGAVYVSGQAPRPKTAPVPVHGQGCVAAGVEASCLVVKDTGSGVLYNLLIRGARPQVGTGIEFTGVPHEGPTMCMQGVPLDVTEWDRKDSVKCTQDATPAPGKTAGH